MGSDMKPLHRFQDASEVRRWLKEKGVTDKVKVRQTASPFTGARFFKVMLAEVPEGVAVVTSSGSREPTRFGSSDGGETAQRYVALEEALSGTNAFPST
jgi:hypothetical protein